MIPEINKLEAIEKACKKLELAMAGYQINPWILTENNIYDTYFDKRKKANSILRKASIEHGIILSGLWSRGIFV